MVTDKGKAVEAMTTWEATDGSQWQLFFHVKRIAGRAECVGLDIRSCPDAYHPERPLGATTMRDLDFATQLARARHNTLSHTEHLMSTFRRVFADAPGLDVSELADEAAVLAQGAGREGGRHAPYTKDQLRRVAAEYLQAYADGSTSPTRDTAEALGLRYVQAAKLVQRCRAKGLLPETVQGIARGATDVEEEAEE